MTDFSAYPQCALCGAFVAAIQVCPRPHRSSSVVSRPPLGLCSTCLRACRRRDWSTVNRRRQDFVGNVIQLDALEALWDSVEQEKIYSIDYGIGAV